MKDVALLPADEARALGAFLFDLDDTLLDHGRLGEAAYSSLFRLKESGLLLVAVTGRPSGWGEVIARQWPVDGVVTENGAVACTSASGKLEIVDFAGHERGARRARLSTIVDAVSRQFPELRPSNDVAARRSDYTFDIGEHERVATDIVDAARTLARSLGARTITSSVHLHVSLDGLDKASGVTRFLAERFAWDRTECVQRASFIGDSDNDEACFSAFRTTIAVANFTGRPTVAPRYVTKAARGAGFAEAARVIVERRGGMTNRPEFSCPVNAPSSDGSASWSWRWPPTRPRGS